MLCNIFLFTVRRIYYNNLSEMFMFYVLCLFFYYININMKFYVNNIY